MARTASSAREGKLASALLDALGSAPDVHLVLERAYPCLLELTSADYGALGISPTGRAADFEWVVAKLPPAFFAAYPEMAVHDFVRTSVAKRPHVVLRDHEMVSRDALEKNMMYRRAREVGAPLEQVMSVMLHEELRWQSGLSLFRAKRRAFSDKDACTLQRVIPAIRAALRNCQLATAAREWSAALESMLESQTTSVILVADDGVEIARSSGAASLVERWFAPHERRAGALPKPLAALLDQARGRLPEDGSLDWSRVIPGKTLLASLADLTGTAGQTRWMIVLRESASAVTPSPKSPSTLTRREQEVTAAVARGLGQPHDRNGARVRRSDGEAASPEHLRQGGRREPHCPRGSRAGAASMTTGARAGHRLRPTQAFL